VIAGDSPQGRQIFAAAGNHQPSPPGAPLNEAPPSDIPPSTDTTRTEVPPTQAPPTAIPPTPIPPTPMPPTPIPTQPPEPTAVPQQPVATGFSGLESAMFQAHNQERSANGIASLQADGTLASIARERAQDMATKGYFSHTSPSGETAFTLMANYGYGYSIAGENIARNNYPEDQSVLAAMNGFMNSPGHRANILEGRFTKVGIGVAIDSDGMIYFAVVFAG
jgi:uncharacterized protein YkwD